MVALFIFNTICFASSATGRRRPTWVNFKSSPAVVPPVRATLQTVNQLRISSDAAAAVLASDATSHAADGGFYYIFLGRRVSLCSNGLNRPESLDKQEFSGGVAGPGQEEGSGWKWQVFVAIRGPYVSNLRALCTLA